jgi:hypothetical protein
MRPLFHAIADANPRGPARPRRRLDGLALLVLALVAILLVEVSR